MESLVCVKLADGRLVFFDRMDTAVDSFKGTYSALPGRIELLNTSQGVEVLFKHERRDPEWAGLIIDVMGWSTIHTRPQHF